VDDSKSDLLHFDRCEEISWQWHEQNLDTLPIAVMVLDGVSNALPALVPFAPFLLELLNEQLRKVFHRVAPDGQIARLGTPSP
jgi:hypothetical protein